MQSLKQRFAELADGDDLSDALRVQLKQLGLELSATDLDDEIVCRILPSRLKIYAKTSMCLWQQHLVRLNVSSWSSSAMCVLMVYVPLN